MQDQTPVTVSVEGVLAACQKQRNNALDENAKLTAFVEQLMAERDQLAAEVERQHAEGGSTG